MRLIGGLCILLAGLAFGSDVNTLESDGDIIQQHLDRIFPALFDVTYPQMGIKPR